ncbi:CDP-glucose 4,6-dehydratase [Terrarubrum flagellatum]|uniref:CDP-glucose 4,6-dehydratase n=1 Tax=Terrirubrum flagellatum TaxID=2895980 RepID=UPI003144D8C4
MTILLRSLGAEVTGLALSPPSGPSLFALADVAGDARSVIGDIRDLAAVEKVYAESSPEIVFHLAAQPIVRRSYVDPLETYMTNVMGTAHVLDAARRSASVNTIVVITSDKCYENPEWEWGCRENDPMGGHDPYSNSKGCAELVTSAYRRSFFMNGKAGRTIGLASARAGNVIGGGDWAVNRLIPDTIRAIAAGEPVNVRNPESVRPWQHVLEPITGYLLLAERVASEPERYSEGWNFGPADEDALPVREILDRFCRHVGHGARWRHVLDEDAPHEARLLRLDIAKARARLGWRPRWTIDKGLEMTAAWYRAYLGGVSMAKITLDQIEAFGP